MMHAHAQVHGAHSSPVRALLGTHTHLRPLQAGAYKMILSQDAQQRVQFWPIYRLQLLTKLRHETPKKLRHKTKEGAHVMQTCWASSHQRKASQKSVPKRSHSSPSTGNTAGAMCTAACACTLTLRPSPASSREQPSQAWQTLHLPPHIRSAGKRAESDKPPPTKTAQACHARTKQANPSQTYHRSLTNPCEGGADLSACLALSCSAALPAAAGAPAGASAATVAADILLPAAQGS